MFQTDLALQGLLSQCWQSLQNMPSCSSLKYNQSQFFPLAFQMLVHRINSYSMGMGVALPVRI